MARGFEADIQDVLFLLKRGIITLEELIRVVEDAVPQARNYDIDPGEMIRYLDVVKTLSRQDPS